MYGKSLLIAFFHSQKLFFFFYISSLDMIRVIAEQRAKIFRDAVINLFSSSSHQIWSPKVKPTRLYRQYFAKRTT
ncbi:UNVERIFIED_CONTAM: hypothetical protein NCL1_08268 [Trichonephila clavipes]